MNEKFLEVGDVMQILGISRSAAYKLMRQINSELEKKGYIVIRGKVSRKYLFWRFPISVLLMSQPASLPEIISCNTARSCSRYSVHLGECLHSLDSYECHGKCLLDFWYRSFSCFFNTISYR
jgi:hypothetical protein